MLRPIRQRLSFAPAPTRRAARTVRVGVPAWSARGAAQTAPLAAIVSLAVMAAPAGAQMSSSGGAVFTPPPPPPEVAAIVDGRAVAPASAPPRVAAAIAAANEIVEKPYVYGGGHRPFSSRLARGYDCSGAVSQALYGGRFLRSPLDSSSFMRWGQRGVGQWITVYTAPSHAYVVIAGLRFDTSMRDPDAPGPGTGPRWSTRLRTSSSFVARHPRGY